MVVAKLHDDAGWQRFRGTSSAAGGNRCGPSAGEQDGRWFRATRLQRQVLHGAAARNESTKAQAAIWARGRADESSESAPGGQWYSAKRHASGASSRAARPLVRNGYHSRAAINGAAAGRKHHPSSIRCCPPLLRDHPLRGPRPVRAKTPGASPVCLAQSSIILVFVWAVPSLQPTPRASLSAEASSAMVLPVC